MSNIIVLAEQQFGKLASGTLSAIGAAKTLAGLIGGGFDIAVAGAGIDGVAAELAGFGAATVYQVEDGALEKYTAQAYARAFHKAVEAAGAKHVIAAATSIGKDCTPRVAARLGAGQASEIVGIEGSEGALVYTRPMWAGNIQGKVKINTEIQVMTVRTTDFDAAAPTGEICGIEKIAGIDTAGLRMKHIGLDSVESDRPSLSDADVVIAGGRGLKNADSFKAQIEGLADVLGGAIGASRAVVDAGWVPNDWQVGQTGKVVAPDLYIAVGISGAIQHLAGMKGSKTIVAINTDPEAPIFSVADYGLVADAFQVVPELIEKLAARKG